MSPKPPWPITSPRRHSFLHKSLKISPFGNFSARTWPLGFLGFLAENIHTNKCSYKQHKLNKGKILQLKIEKLWYFWWWYNHEWWSQFLKQYIPFIADNLLQNLVSIYRYTFLYDKPKCRQAHWLKTLLKDITQWWTLVELCHEIITVTAIHMVRPCSMITSPSMSKDQWTI